MLEITDKVLLSCRSKCLELNRSLKSISFRCKIWIKMLSSIWSWCLQPALCTRPFCISSVDLLIIRAINFYLRQRVPACSESQQVITSFQVSPWYTTIPILWKRWPLYGLKTFNHRSTDKESTTSNSLWRKLATTSLVFTQSSIVTNSRTSIESTQPSLQWEAKSFSKEDSNS